MPLPVEKWPYKNWNEQKKKTNETGFWCSNNCIVYIIISTFVPWHYRQNNSYDILCLSINGLVASIKVLYSDSFKSSFSDDFLYLLCIVCYFACVKPHLYVMVFNALIIIAWLMTMHRNQESNVFARKEFFPVMIRTTPIIVDFVPKRWTNYIFFFTTNEFKGSIADCNCLNV